MSYRSTVREVQFLFDRVVGFGSVAATGRFSEATPDTVAAILGEAGRMCEEVMAPVQRNGDLSPAILENGVVRTPPGFSEAWRKIAEGGWIAMSGETDYGGMGLPRALTTAVNEMMSAACLSLQLLPLMTQGQIEALECHASDEIKALYLPRLMSGEWAGTMNLTEAQAGSDVGALATKAEPNGDGSFAITGQKIFISWGDNDFTGNVCHLVLARLPDAVPGTGGISLFIVPKRLPNPDGGPGVANRLKVVGVEHKLGLHGSPTCVMQYEGAAGWLVGKPHRGMAAMFTMMNNARLGVGGQGVGAAEGAFQLALAYATTRKQGKTRVPGSAGMIVDHADVRRMLTEMKADIFAARAILLSCAVAIDMQTATGDADWAARAAFLTPIAKTFGTETGIHVAQQGVQVHGGMGYIEETGAAQFARDVRVTAIYEGTNGVQAMDLVARKMMDGGKAAFRLLDEVATGAGSARTQHPDMAAAVARAAIDLRAATEWLVGQSDLQDRFAGAIPYLRAFARVLGGGFHLKAAMAKPGSARVALARFYITRMMPEYLALLAHAQAGAEGLYSLSADDLAAT